MPSGRSAGPASRPPRRGSAARPAASGARHGPRVRRPSPPRRPAATGPRASATTPSTAKVCGAGLAAGAAGSAARSSNRRFVRGAVLAAIVVFLAVLLAPTVAAWVQQRGADRRAPRAGRRARSLRVAGLRAEQERWDDPAYVEQQARQRLKFVTAGRDAVHGARPPARDAPTPRSIPAPASTGRPALPWYTTVWESVRTADAPGAHR